MYPYPMEDETRKYTREISRVIGLISILFGVYIPPTGFLMGIVGLYYEKKDAMEHEEVYNFWNLVLNSVGMIIGGLMTLYILMFKMQLF